MCILYLGFYGFAKNSETTGWVLEFKLHKQISNTLNTADSSSNTSLP